MTPVTWIHHICKNAKCQERIYNEIICLNDMYNIGWVGTYTFKLYSSDIFTRHCVNHSINTASTVVKCQHSIRKQHVNMQIFETVWDGTVAYMEHVP